MGFISDFLGDITGSNAAASGASQAADIQAAASREGVAEQRRQFDKIIELMSPYVTAGTSALTGQQDLLGLNGADQQSAAIAQLQGSPAFTSLMQQGENAILSNASATGGLRGGNVQRALGTFRPQLLSQLISQQLSGLGGLSQLGQASAAGQASAGLSSGNAISSLLQQAGAAQAGGALAQGQAGQTGFNNLLKAGAVIGGFF